MNRALQELGWDGFFERQLAAAPPGAVPGRVTAEFGGCYRVEHAGGEALASLSGKLKHTAGSTGEIRWWGTGYC
ncbi:MAG TPA: hypothetical protein PKI19_14635, partial [Elusimicrobiales bacterium]|nr:hypothetical protein [Elusimicrobiales bacterium]